MFVLVSLGGGEDGRFYVAMGLITMLKILM